MKEFKKLNLLTFTVATLVLLVSCSKRKPRKTYPKDPKVCEEIRTTYLATVKSGASVTVLSKGANDLYSIVSYGKGQHCKYLRYAFRTLKKPYNGDKVTPAQWQKAITNIKNKSEY